MLRSLWQTWLPRGRCLLAKSGVPLDVPTLEGWLWVHRDLGDQGQEVHINDVEADARLGDECRSRRGSAQHNLEAVEG
jgi:hypothetical protein